MLFGSFFTVYFFDRVVNNGVDGVWPPDGVPASRPFVAGINTLILVTLELHDALGDAVDQEGNRAGLCAGMVLTFLLGLDLPAHADHRVHRIGFNTSDTAFAATFFGLTGLHGCHVFVGLTILLVDDDPIVPRALHARAPSRDRARRDLLALRRRDVDRGLRDGLPPLSCRCGTRSGAKVMRSGSFFWRSATSA